jgi:hypothetical protein
VTHEERADVIRRPAQRDGGEPPDVIVVAFPAARRDLRGHRKRLLLVTSLAAACVALGALTWQAWP